MVVTAALGSCLIGRPVIWDREDERWEEAGSPKVRARAERLGRALKAMGVASGQRVVVLCCSEHAEDRHVATTAARGLDAAVIIPVDWGASALTLLFADLGGPTVHLACEEGVVAWREARGSGIMIGDGLDVLWWKALECRYATEPAP